MNSTRHSTQFRQAGQDIGAKQLLPAGTMLYNELTATCNEVPALVKVQGFWPVGGPYLDAAGYRPQLQRAYQPNIIPGVYPSTANPLPFFNVGREGETQVMAVTATANSKRCGQWDASCQSSFDIAPLSVEPFNFNKYAELGKFAISGYLYFGLGTRLWPGFVVQQRVEFLQTGYFGVIQRVRGTYAYITRTSREWIRIIDEQSYVLDVERDATDYINQRQKVRAGIITTVRFQDAPGIELDGLLKKSPGTVGVEIDAAFETYFVFNPSSTGDPNLDMNTIWYPVGQPIAWKAAARIELAGDDPWEPAAWRFVSNACNVYPSVMAPFPTWTGRVQNSVREEGARSLRLILNEEMP